MKLTIRAGQHAPERLNAIGRAAQAFEYYNGIDAAWKSVQIGGMTRVQVTTIHEQLDASWTR